MPYVKEADFARIQRMVTEAKEAMGDIRDRVFEIANEMGLLASTNTEIDSSMLEVWIEELRELAGRIK